MMNVKGARSKRSEVKVAVELTYRASSALLGPGEIGVNRSRSEATVGAPILRVALIVIRGGCRDTAALDESRSGTASDSRGAAGSVGHGSGNCH